MSSRVSRVGSVGCGLSRSRRLVLMAIGAVSVAAAVGAQFAPEWLFDVRQASTPQLLGLLGLLVLPGVTAFALLADGHCMRRRRGVSAAVSQPHAHPQANAESPPPDRPLAERVEAFGVVPVSAAALATSWPTGPQPARVHTPTAPSVRRPVPRIEIVVERKPTPQLVTISRGPVGPGAVRSAA